MKVTLIGTGLMGFPMAEKLLEAGFRTTVYNRTPSKAEPLGERGAGIAGTAAEAIQASEIIILMLADYPAIESVLFANDTSPDFKDRTIIQMGTILPAESLQLREMVRKSGGEYLEAPVLGSIPNVQARQLILLVGATQDQFREFETVFRAFGSDIYWIGDVGKAAAVKLALNHLIVGLTASFSLSLGLVQKNGIDVDLFMAILRHSALYAPTFDKKLSRMLERDFGDAHFPVKHLCKDVDLVLKESQSAGLNTTVLEGIREVLERTVELGHAEADYSALFDAITSGK
jgi:3-hydroxyisobutyrate dehydrogenase